MIDFLKMSFRFLELKKIAREFVGGRFYYKWITIKMFVDRGKTLRPVARVTNVHKQLIIFTGSLIESRSY